MKNKTLLTLILQFVVSTTMIGMDVLAQTPQKTFAYTNDDVWAAYEGFNKTLLDSGKYIYKTNSSDKNATDRFNGAAAIWCQPTYWDMAMNAYKLAKTQKDKKKATYYKELCDKIFAGNKAQYAHFDFDDNNENTGWFIYDDIMWWTITLARAYELFEVDEYLRLSEESFSRVWYGSKKVGDTGSYDKENGGMFWQWQPIHNPNPNKPGDGKMACINFPVAVAALTLYNNVPKSRKESSEESPKYQTKAQYLAKGKEIYEWGVENLLDKKTGLVADSRHGKGTPAWKAHIYNQATFIGASVLLYKATGEKRYLDNAILAADYSVNQMSAQHNLLPFEKGIEQGIYTAIFAQYMAMLVNDCGQIQYVPFLKRNIEVGWANRDKTRNVCGGRYWQVLPDGADIDSYSASGIPALMLLFPTDE
ncbi:glycoside hydrolase family 76 protein [Bacteroides sp.]|uniref:glycoside hydrolase family 76 protein n=1 Tax=Bacteroides sp. TaxID=29523 RepID=UPI00261315EA|nr:glycoside hydrolase family 76 protein [Bacteroides sp.]MDD3038286.1 glycoside hydrolase family 76 protein [Bacteroides sp.]